MKNNPNLNELKSSFACILCGIIKSDGKISSKEREKFDEFFVKEFSLESSNIDALFHDNIEDASYDEHVDLLKIGFEGSPMLMARFMKYLKALILSDGVSDGEYAVFERVRVGVFV